MNSDLIKFTICIILIFDIILITVVCLVLYVHLNQYERSRITKKNAIARCKNVNVFT